MNVLLIFCFIFGGFTQKWYIPQGTERSAGRILIGDTDRDDNYEFMFTTYGGPYAIYYYELHLPNTWEVDTIFYPYAPLLWDSDDFDGDGFYDLVMQCGSIDPFWVGIAIFESPDSFSYPTQEVWRDTVGFALVQPISVYDVDKDSSPEIFKLGWKKENTITTYYPFGIYESIGDNKYDTIFMGTGLGSLSSTIAFGNFDIDNSNEFIVGNIDGEYQIWECIGNNSYQLLEQQQLPTANIKDCFSVPDADSDGKPEFIVKGFTFPDGKFRVFIFEAIGDNTYEIIDTLIFSGFSNGYYRGHSAVGDVDGDGLPEIALEGSFRVYMIEADGNDNFYVFDTLPGNSRGSSIAMYDIDGNGLDEVVISGNNETRIYEWSGGAISENPGFRNPGAEFLFYPNIFKGDVKIDFTLPFDQKTDVSLYDAAGRLLRKMKVSKRVTITEKNLHSGIYFLRIENPVTGKATCWKFLKIE